MRVPHEATIKVWTGAVVLSPGLSGEDLLRSPHARQLAVPRDCWPSARGITSLTHGPLLGAVCDMAAAFLQNKPVRGQLKTKATVLLSPSFFRVPCTGNRSVGPAHAPGKGVARESSGSISEVAWRAVCLSLSDSVKSELP